MQELKIKPVFETENVRIMGRDFKDVTGEVAKMGSVKDGTVVVRFRNYKKQGYMALMNILTDQYPASYFSIYIKHANQVGFLKTLISADRCVTHTLDIHGDLPMDFGFVNTMALTAEHGVGYTLYYNGKKAAFVADENAALLSDLYALAPLDRAMLGDFLEPQKMLEKHYPYHGDIDFIRMYDRVLQEDYLLSFTSQAIHNFEVPTPQGTYQSKPMELFDANMYNSRGYRIPTLLRTQKGSLLAFIDQRFYGGADHPNRIHTVVRRSTDNGETFGEPIKIIGMPKNAQTIDTCSVQDEATGRIFLITDAFPETMTTFTVQNGTGWDTENKELCRILVNAQGTRYLVHANGSITLQGQATGMRLCDKDELVDEAGNSLGNVWTENAFLRIYPTCHLLLLASDDDGVSWQVIRDLNPETKEAWMHFFGCGPGNGIQLKHGKYAGRLLLPVYFFNRHGSQAAELIYSDDHGESWHRGASPVDGWNVDGHVLEEQTLNEHEYETLEAQLTELSDGTVLYYMRNGRHKALGAYSSTGGESWSTEENFYDEALTGPCGQFGIVHSDCKIDGKEAYFCSLHLYGENCGTVKTGLEEQRTLANGKVQRYIDWKYSKTVRLGTYCYSAICNVTPGIVAIFYESSSSMSMTFQKMDLKFLMSQDIPVDVPHVTAVNISAEGGGLTAYIQWNMPVMPIMPLETPWVLLHCGDKVWQAKLVQRTDDSDALIFRAENTGEAHSGEYRLELAPGLEICNMRAQRCTESEVYMQ